MADSSLPILRSDLRVTQPTTPPHERVSGFRPLKLVLQPNGLAVELTRPNMLLGRHSTADLRLPLPDVSRRHCRFLYQDGAWRIFDLESMNGIYVNGERRLEATLHDQDLLGIGGFHFRVLIASEPRNQSDREHQCAETGEVVQSIAKAMTVTQRLLEPPQRKAS